MACISVGASGHPTVNPVGVLNGRTEHPLRRPLHPSFDPSRSLQVSLPQLLTAFRIYFQVHVVSSPCPYSLSPSLICAVLFPSVFPLHTSSIPIRGRSETSFDLSCSLNPPNPISPRPSSSPKDSAPALVFSHITSLTAMFFPV